MPRGLTHPTLLVRVTRAAKELGVSPATVRRWEAEGKLAPKKRTSGGHRLYDYLDVQALRAESNVPIQPPVYAVRHISTRNWIVKRRGIKGASNATYGEPMPWTGDQEPRFWPSLPLVRQGLALWLDHQIYYQPADMEIVRFKMVEGGCIRNGREREIELNGVASPLRSHSQATEKSSQTT